MASTITRLIFVLVDVLFIIQKVSGDCLNGFFVHGSSCYKEFGIRATWAEADVYCEMYGGHLVVIETDSEQQYLAAYISKLSAATSNSSPRHYGGKRSFNSGTFWLGASNLQIEGEWMWLNSGGKMRYSNWKQGEPNNANSIENCLEMSFSNNFRWNDNNCNSKINFICEIENRGGSPGQIVG